MKLKIGKISDILRVLGSGNMHHGWHVLCGEALVVEVGGRNGPFEFSHHSKCLLYQTYVGTSFLDQNL